MKVKSKAELKHEIKIIGDTVLQQANVRVSEGELKLYRLRNEVLKAEAELNQSIQWREQLRAYIKQAG